MDPNKNIVHCTNCNKPWTSTNATPRLCQQCREIERLTQYEQALIALTKQIAPTFPNPESADPNILAWAIQTAVNVKTNTTYLYSLLAQSK